jgi:hypothetical protein
MVALSGGLFLSMVVFALARDSTRFYQREGRLASATLAGIVGFKRLTEDIARAGYLSTPNVQSDPRNCTPVASLPAGLQTLAAVRITPDTPDLINSNAAFQLNKTSGQIIKPDQIVLSGSYAATDDFAVASGADGTTITLQTGTTSMARIGYLATSDVHDQANLLKNVFGADPGQILRLQDTSGMIYFGEIAAVTGGPNPSVTLKAPLPLMRAGLGTCGMRATARGSTANVVNIVRYRVMDLQHDTDQGASWAPLFASSAGAAGETTRTELVRDQLSAQGTPIANTTDIVAEYAVDMEFSVFGQLTAGNPPLTFSEPGSGTFTTFFTANGVGDRPQGVRAVRARLSVRSREADRTTNVSLAGGIYRFQIGAAEWARVRTFQTDVTLPNLREVTW